MQLFNSLDPAPFHEKDLDEDAEEYIVGTVREFPLKTPMKLDIYLPAEAAARQSRELVAEAIHNFFDYKTRLTSRELQNKLRQGRVSLLIGLLFLFACISARQVVGNLGNGTVHEIITEGLLISGWVAMWRPIQIFLYDWWPIRRMRSIYIKLSHIRIDLHPIT